MYNQQSFTCSLALKRVAQSEIKLKRNTETASNSFTLVSASSAYFSTRE